MLNFKAAAVRTDAGALRFHDALTAGPAALAEFVGAAPMWWAPVMDGRHDARWRTLFLSSPVFRGWVARHGSQEA